MNSPRTRRGVPPALLAGAVVVLLTGTVLVLGQARGGDGDHKPKARSGQPSSPAVTASLTAKVAQRLDGLPALRYSGTFTSNGTPVRAELTVTKGGSAIGSLTRAGERAELVTINARTFLKADASFWREAVSTTALPEDFAGRWAKAPTTVLGFNVKDFLAPASIARRLRSAQAPSAAEDVGGRSGYRINTAQGGYWASAAAPHSLLRVQGASDSLFTVTELPDAAPSFTKLRQRVGALGGALDPVVTFQAGTLEFVNCNENVKACALRLPVSTEAPAVAGDPGTGATGTGSLRAVLLAKITTADRTLGTCTATQALGPTRRAVLSCTVTSEGWRSFMRKARDVPGNHKYSAQARVVAEAVAKAEVAGLLTQVDQERPAG